MRVVVTGGAGFIGGHLVERLATEHDVVALDLLPEAEAVLHGAAKGRASYVVADVRRASDLVPAFRGADVVFHLAALASVPASFREPDAFNATNTHGTLEVLRAAAAETVRRVVFASTCAVYGASPPPLREDAPLDLVSPYAVTKAAGELWCALYDELGVETVALRPFNVYGPRQPAGGPYGAVIPTFLRALARGERPAIYGDGEQTRDFVFVGDVIDAFERAASAPNVSGEIVNVGSGTPVSVNELLAIANDVLGTAIEPRREPARAGDIRASYADVDKAQRILGFRARVGLAQGLLAMAEATGDAR